MEILKWEEKKNIKGSAVKEKKKQCNSTEGGEIWNDGIKVKYNGNKYKKVSFRYHSY